MSRWFRFYEDSLNDPKVQRLSGDMFKAWVNLLCLASKNEGVLPPLQDIAFGMRLVEEAVCVLLNQFCERGLLDPIEVDGGPMSYEPHNWNGRQYKSDKSDPTAPARQKTYRERNKNRNADRNDTVTPTVTVTPPRAETEQIQNGGGEEARARGKSLISEEAFEVAGKLLDAMGLQREDPLSVGAPMTVQSWLNGGWPAEIIVVGVKTAMANRKHDPPGTLKYFEKAIARTHAEMTKPLPVAVMQPQEKINVRTKPQNAIIQAADDLYRQIAGFDGPAREPDELRGGSGETPARLLSHG